MNRTTGMLILLAVTGGCTSMQQEPGLECRACCDGKVQSIPGPAPTVWSEHDRYPRGYPYGVGTAAAARTGRPLLVAQNSATDGAGSAAAASGEATPSLLPPKGRPHEAEALPAPKPAEAAAAEGEAKPDTLPAPEARPAHRTVGVLEQQPKQSPPSVRMVNSKHITINYEVKDVGPSGLSGIELWYTQDGKAWKKRDISPQAKPPYVVEVDGEGLYGFTILARNGIGLAKEPPKAGDLPQVWVEVDLTKPEVHLTGVNAKCTPQSQNVVIRWTASDKNLAARPITISYAEKEDGPWTPVATQLENTGRYEWPLPAEAPSRFLVRVEARDTVGNIGSAQTPKAVLMDRSQPQATITTVEGGQ